jgi:transcriptional regulator with XRE-family HTH domain
MPLTHHLDPVVQSQRDLRPHRRAALGLAIRHHREDRGLSRTTLAQITGLTVPEIIDLEGGQSVPTVDVVFAIADTLDTDAAELLHEARALAEELSVNHWLFRRQGRRR